MRRQSKSDTLAHLDQKDGLRTVEKLLLDALWVLGSGRPVQVSDIYRQVEPLLIGNMGIEDGSPTQGESGRHASFDQAQVRLVDSGAIAVVGDWVTFIAPVPPELEDFPGGPAYRAGTEHWARQRQTSRSNWLEQVRQEQLKATELAAIQRDRDAAYDAYFGLVRQHIADGYLSDPREIESCIGELTKLAGLSVAAAKQRLGLKQQARTNAKLTKRAVPESAPPRIGDDKDLRRMRKSVETSGPMTREALAHRLRISLDRMDQLVSLFGKTYPDCVREEPQRRRPNVTNIVIHPPTSEDSGDAADPVAEAHR
jgi:hypothetical protein